MPSWGTDCLLSFCGGQRFVGHSLCCSKQTQSYSKFFGIQIQMANSVLAPLVRLNSSYNPCQIKLFHKEKRVCCCIIATND